MCLGHSSATCDPSQDSLGSERFLLSVLKTQHACNSGQEVSGTALALHPATMGLLSVPAQAASLDAVVREGLCRNIRGEAASGISWPNPSGTRQPSSLQINLKV